jgi:cytochrome P450
VHSFNGGPRICPGQVFSTFETMYILARMAQEFKWVERRDSKVDWEPIIGLATLNRLGTKVALAKA